MPGRMERLARDVLTSPLRITVGEVGAANEDINQVIVWTDSILRSILAGLVLG